MTVKREPQHADDLTVVMLRMTLPGVNGGRGWRLLGLAESVTAVVPGSHLPPTMPCAWLYVGVEGEPNVVMIDRHAAFDLAGIERWFRDVQERFERLGWTIVDPDGT